MVRRGVPGVVEYWHHGEHVVQKVPMGSAALRVGIELHPGKELRNGESR